MSKGIKKVDGVYTNVGATTVTELGGRRVRIQPGKTVRRAWAIEFLDGEAAKKERRKPAPKVEKPAKPKKEEAPKVEDDSE